MDTTKKYYVITAALFFLICFLSCSEKGKKSNTNMPPPVILRKDTSTVKKPGSSKNAPIINITDTLAPKANIIYIKDSAATAYRLSEKLGQIYGVRLGAVLKQNKLKMAGAPMAWYRTQKAPFFFEAGVAVDKKPVKLPKNIFLRSIGGDSALIAHYYGPYEQISVAYEALRDWLKTHKMKIKAPPYEIYIGDPIDKNGNPMDPYKVQTDIVFTHD